MSYKHTIVVKIGTSNLTQPETRKLVLSTINSLVKTLTKLRQLGHNVVLVSSGAVGVGCSRLKVKETPKKISLKQAIAAVGQGRLMHVYDELFTSIDQPIAQILVTRRELMERSCYINARNTFNALFKLGVIPIVNENDTVAIEELKFGDNDTLSASVASLINADWLFILTDVDYLYSADPRLFPDAQPISNVDSVQLAKLQVQANSTGSQWGTGGMLTKLTAAKLATKAGITTVITNGKYPENLIKILDGEDIGTKFGAYLENDNARKRWISYGLLPTGKLYLNEESIIAISQKGKSLLVADVIRVEGNFKSFEAVRLCNEGGEEVARGIVNYSKHEIDKINKNRLDNISQLPTCDGYETIVHKNNLVISKKNIRL